MNLPIESILANLIAFYDFRGKHVIHVGAGGGSLIGYAGLAGHVTAIDNDPAAVTALRDRIGECRDRDRFTVLTADFRAVAPRGDVVLFEFCLHLMDDPAAQLRHARTLAPEMIVLGHAPGSEWSWYAGEESVVASSWAAVARTTVRRRRCFDLPRRFDDYRAVHQKFAALGETSRQRIAAPAIAARPCNRYAVLRRADLTCVDPGPLPGICVSLAVSGRKPACELRPC